RASSASTAGQVRRGFVRNVFFTPDPNRFLNSRFMTFSCAAGGSRRGSGLGPSQCGLRRSYCAIAVATGSAQAGEEFFSEPPGPPAGPTQPVRRAKLRPAPRAPGGGGPGPPGAPRKGNGFSPGGAVPKPEFRNEEKRLWLQAF